MKRILYVVAAALFIAGCATPDLTVKGDKRFAFSAFRQYSWLPTPGKMGPGLPSGNPALDQAIRTAVDETLALKGYQRVPLDDAQWMIEYQVFAKDPSKKVSSPIVGSLMLNVTSGVPSRPIWQGLVQIPPAQATDAANPTGFVREAVQKLLARLPSP